MADPTLRDLLGSDNEDDALTFLLTQLASIGFPTVNWQSGGVIYTLLKAFSRALAVGSGLLRDITAGGLLKLSTSGWLTLLADWYSSPAAPVARFPATFAQGQVLLNVSIGNGPYPLDPGQVIVQESVAKHRYLSINPISVTLPAGPSNTIVPFIAENPGSAFNVSPDTGLTLVTPLPGVTASFYVPSGSNSWLMTQGTDEETDASLQTRCRAKWGTVGFLKPADGYLFLAINTPGVGTKPTKTVVRDDNPRGPGTVDIWLAAGDGPIPTADETLVRNYLLSLANPTADLQVQNATGVTVNVSATLYYGSAFSTAVATAIDGIVGLIQFMAIGGTLGLDDVIKVLKDTPGQIKVPIPSVLINGINDDLTIGDNEVAVVGTIAITGVVVQQ